MPNIEYLFRGYNILTGNPLSIGYTYDPGFRELIFEHTSDKGSKIPRNVDVVRTESCIYNGNSKALMTMTDYKKELTSKVAVEGGGSFALFQAAFSLSTEYRQMRQEIEKKGNTIIRSEAKCQVYDALIQSGSPPKLSSNFVRYVKTLLETEDYQGFINAFGTHFVTQVEMGVRYGVMNARLHVGSSISNNRIISLSLTLPMTKLE